MLTRLTKLAVCNQIIREREGKEGDMTTARLALPIQCTDDLQMELGGGLLQFDCVEPMRILREAT